MNAALVYAVAAVAAAATLYGAIRFFGARAQGGGAEAEESRLEVLSRTPIGLGGSLVVVRFEGRRILLGVTRGQWTALADLGRVSAGPNPGSLSVIDAELNRAFMADRLRRGRKGS
jgi:flagellar biogenesis protein FliO